jgi:hypothetical protein
MYARANGHLRRAARYTDFPTRSMLRRALVMQSPDIGKQYFLDVATAVPANGPPDRAKLVAVMARYGLKPGAPA